MSKPKGAKGSMTVALQNFAGLREQLQGMDEAAERAVKRTVSDFKSRAPAWISQAVTEHYGIKKAEVIAYEDLGAEAIRRLEVEDFPVVVIIDSEGNNLYETGRAGYLATQE